jgi:hypothetical protein
MKPVKAIEPEVTDEYWEEFLTDLYGEVNVCGMTYESGRLLKEIDPIAFQCGKSDYESGLDVRYACGECGDDYHDRYDAERCCAEEEE